jgi:hypothetical protein
MQKSLLDCFIELMQRDYPEDWAGLCQLAYATEPGNYVSILDRMRYWLTPEGAARWYVRSYKRTNILDPLPSDKITWLCRTGIERFADAFRNQMVGRIKNTLDMRPLDPALITAETLRFDPDELVLDGGELVIVDVRIEPPPILDAPVSMASVKESPAAARNSGGAAPVADWETVDKEVFHLMDENGEFIDGDPEWNAQARLEKAISDYCETTFHIRPGENTVRTHVRKALKVWRERKTET